jgi:hypothetical protein
VNENLKTKEKRVSVFSVTFSQLAYIIDKDDFEFSGSVRVTKRLWPILIQYFRICLG